MMHLKLPSSGLGQGLHKRKAQSVVGDKQLSGLGQGEGRKLWKSYHEGRQGGKTQMEATLDRSTTMGTVSIQEHHTQVSLCKCTAL